VASAKVNCELSVNLFDAMNVPDALRGNLDILVILAAHL
jgi:hypothetical protein